MVLFRTHDRKVATPHKTQEHRAFIPFFTSQSPHLSSNLTKFRLHSKTSYQKLFLLIWFRFLPVSNSLAKFYLYFKTAYQVSFLLGFSYLTKYWLFLHSFALLLSFFGQTASSLCYILRRMFNLRNKSDDICKYIEKNKS